MAAQKLLASSLLMTKSRFGCSLAAAAAAASPSTLFTTTNNLRAFPLSDHISTFRGGIGVWEAKRSYSSILNGLREDVKEVPVNNNKKSFTKICMVVKTFENQNSEADQQANYPPHQNKIRLPTKRSLITVLRSPHVHKKSREQFFFTTKKQHLVIQAQPHELAKKYFWLKRHRIMGAQFEIKFFCKTRFQLARGTPALASI